MSSPPRPRSVLLGHELHLDVLRGAILAHVAGGSIRGRGSSYDVPLPYRLAFPSASCGHLRWRSRLFLRASSQVRAVFSSVYFHLFFSCLEIESLRIWLHRSSGEKCLSVVTRWFFTSTEKSNIKIQSELRALLR